MVVSAVISKSSKKAARVDSYVIRIYRRDAGNPVKIAGQVEFVEREETRSFGDAGELIAILAGGKGRKWGLKSKRAKQSGERVV